MTKSELITRIALRRPQFEQKDAEVAVKMILDAMTQFLVEGHRIEIRSFGTFACLYRPPRVGRNPKTAEAVQIPAKRVPHFKAGRELRERVNGRKERPKDYDHAVSAQGKTKEKKQATLRKVALRFVQRAA